MIINENGYGDQPKKEEVKEALKAKKLKKDAPAEDTVVVEENAE